MNSPEQFGHRVAGCKGRWIDVTALSDTRRTEKCSECRGVQHPYFYDEIGDDGEIVDLGSASGNEESRGSGLLWWGIVAVLLATITWWLWG